MTNVTDHPAKPHRRAVELVAISAAERSEQLEKAHQVRLARIDDKIGAKVREIEELRRLRGDVLKELANTPENDDLHREIDNFDERIAALEKARQRLVDARAEAESQNSAESRTRAAAELAEMVVSIRRRSAERVPLAVGVSKAIDALAREFAKFTESGAAIEGDVIAVYRAGVRRMTGRDPDSVQIGQVRALVSDQGVLAALAHDLRAAGLDKVVGDSFDRRTTLSVDVAAQCNHHRLDEILSRAHGDDSRRRQALDERQS